MRFLPASPRRRRRLLYASPAFGFALVVALLFAFYRHPVKSDQIPTHPGKAQVYALPKPMPASAHAKKEALRTLDVFIRSAALRHDLARSWPLASPKMRQGTSHADWLHGNLPVYPYPAAQFRAVSYRVTGTYAGGIVDVDALLVPKKADGFELVYSCELHPNRGRWLVDYCYPRKSF
ncbi:MAG TPA: hypothetical protein VFI37_07815 [Gaiellaceae bacterium]|nr:hypothetical protein [Gaiellaceae bacterium]